MSAEGLAAPTQAKLVRAGKDGRPINDGVFPESKEYLAGFWIVDVDSPERGSPPSTPTNACRPTTGSTPSVRTCSSGRASRKAPWCCTVCRGEDDERAPAGVPAGTRREVDALMVTLVRRLVGLVMVVVAGLVYADMAEKGTFACERATRTCVHTVERLTGPLPARTIPLADVLGAGAKHSYWDESPGAGEALARARSMEDVSPETLYVTRPSSGRSSSSSSIVIFTRQGLVSLLPGSPGSADVSAFTRFLAGEGDRFALVQDDRFSSLPLPLILGGLGLVLLLFRGPDPPREMP